VRLLRLTPALWLFLTVVAALSVGHGGGGASASTAPPREHRSVVDGGAMTTITIRGGPRSFRHLVDVRDHGKPTSAVGAPPRLVAVAAGDRGSCDAIGDILFERTPGPSSGRRLPAPQQPRAPPGTLSL
jgi:hypothetical protein